MSREKLAEQGQQIRNQLQHRTHPDMGSAAVPCPVSAV